MPTAWDIYAQRLTHLGYGWPLWGPEPDNTFGEVRLGDVGYLLDGRFCFLFNAMRSADDPVNSQQGVPSNFVVFAPPRSQPIHQPNWITQTQLHSTSLRSVSVAATASASEAVISASAGLRFECREDSGALLLLKQPAHKTFLACKSHILKYAATHLASWVEFANTELGIGLEEKDLIFVSGFMKTTMWAVASFSNNNNSELVIAGGCFVPSASGEFRVSISRGEHGPIHSRVGPYDRVSTWTEGDNPAFKYDQCIFLSYFKQKRRRMEGLLRLRAGAGYDTLPLPDRDHREEIDPPPAYSSNPPSYFDSEESGHGPEENYDPVNEVLGFILKHSTADVACASDQALSFLFGARGIPSNLKAELEALAPKIIIQQSDMGTIGLLEVEADPELTIENDARPETKPIVEELPYPPYETSRQRISSSALSYICFKIRGPSSDASPEVGVPDDGFPLLKALNNDLAALVDGQMPSPLGDEVSVKLSLRLIFPGCEPYTRQIRVRRSTSGSAFISLGTLAHKIAQEMQRCLARTDNAGKPLMHRGRIVHLEDLLLWRLSRVSPGSWVPEFMVITHLHGQAACSESPELVSACSLRGPSPSLFTLAKAESIERLQSGLLSAYSFPSLETYSCSPLEMYSCSSLETYSFSGSSLETNSTHSETDEREVWEQKAVRLQLPT